MAYRDKDNAKEKRKQAREKKKRENRS